MGYIGLGRWGLHCAGGGWGLYRAKALFINFKSINMLAVIFNEYLKIRFCCSEKLFRIFNCLIMFPSRVELCCLNIPHLHTVL